MYGKINQISKLMKNVKQNNNTCGKLMIKNYNHAMSDNGIISRIDHCDTLIRQRDIKIEQLKREQSYLMEIGEIEDALDCQYEITELQKQIDRYLQQFKKLTNIYDEIVTSNEKILDILNK